MGYATGILLESVAFGNESKIQSLVQTGSLSEKWIPFGIGSAFLKSNSYESAISLDSGSLLFIQEGNLLVNDPILTNGYVDFTIEKVPEVDEFGNNIFVNKVTECIFQPKDSIPEVTCLICNLTDISGIPVAHGLKDLTGIGLNALQPEVLTIHPIDEVNDPWANNVDNIHGVSIKVCLPGDGGEGCTPGFWKTHGVDGPATPDSWPETGPDHLGGNIDPLTEDTLYFTVFGENPVIQNNWNGGTGSLLEALNAEGGGINAFARHSVAAYLNSITSVDYDIPTATIFAMVTDAFATGEFEAAKNIFEAANELGCPLGNNPPNGPDEELALSETGGVDPVTFDGTADTPYEKKQDAILTLDDLVNNPPLPLLPSTVNELTFASTSINDSIDPIYWVNDYHIDIINGQIVLDKSKEAVLALVAITNDPNEDQGVKDTVQLVIDQLMSADLELAQTAIDDISACGGKNTKIDNHLSSAQTKMTQALQDSNDKKYDQAIQKFYSAWLDAYEATTACPSGYWTQLDGYTVVP